MISRKNLITNPFLKTILYINNIVYNKENYIILIKKSFLFFINIYSVIMEKIRCLGTDVMIEMSRYLIKAQLKQKIIKRHLFIFLYNEFITNFIYHWNFRLCFKQKKHYINAYFNRNNAISYHIFNIG